MVPRSIITLTLLTAVFFSPPALSAKTYTPVQLRDMIKAGKYPKQGTPKKQVETVSFRDCVDKVRSTLGAVKTQYPTEILVDAGIVLVAKIWANDGAMTMTCSKHDRSIILTNAPYI